jgi:hypothetical protein
MSQTHHPRRRRAHHPRPAVHEDAAGHPHRVGMRAQAAPTIDIDIAPDQVDDLQREIAVFPDLKDILGPAGADGHYGPHTYRAIARIAEEAHIPVADISRIDFRGKTGELYTKWHTALQNHHKENETPQQVVTRVEQAQGPSAAELAVAAEAARLAAETAAREAANNRVPASIRGTQYDPRYLATLSTPELINVAKDGLHGIGEIKGGIFGSYHRNGRLNETVSNKLLEHAHEMGIVPHDQNTLTRRELELTVASLGEATVRHTGFALAQLPPETNPMTVPVAAPTTASTTPAAPTPPAVGLTDNARAQADSVRGGLAGGVTTDEQSRVVAGRRTRDGDDMPRQRDQHVRVEGGEQTEGPDAVQHLPQQTLVDKRRPIRVV